MKLILENWQNFVNEQSEARVGQTTKARGTDAARTDTHGVYVGNDKETLLKTTDLKPLLEYFKQNDKFFDLVEELSQKLDDETFKARINDFASDPDHYTSNEPEYKEVRTGLLMAFDDLLRAAQSAGLVNEEEMSPALTKILKLMDARKATVVKAIPQMASRFKEAINKSDPKLMKQIVASKNPMNPSVYTLTQEIMRIEKGYLQLSRATTKLKKIAKNAPPEQKDDSESSDTPLEAAVDKAVDNAEKSENPKEQIKQDAETIANNAGKPEAADKIEQAIEDRVGDSPGGQTDNPDKVDPEPDDLVELKKTYLAFRDKFYCPIDKDANRRQRREARLRCSKEGIAISKNDQHDKITDLITALEDIIEKEEGEAGYDSSKQQLQEQSSRPIVALKADLTMFLKQARGAQNIINKAQELAGTKAGKYHLKKAIERAKNVLELTGGLYDDLRRISKGLGQRTKQTPPKSDLNEAAQEVEKAYNLVLSNIEDVIGDIGDDLPQSEFLPRMKKSLEGLESILKYFPKGRLGGKGSSGSGEIYTKYKEALSQFGNDFSILKNLPDELSDKDAGSTSLNVAAQQIRAFANDLVEIFGLQMPTSFNKKVEQGPPVEVPGTPDTEQPKEDPEQVIQDLAVDLEAAAEAAIQKATEELPDGSPEEIAKRAGEILAADKAAEEELRKQAETEAAAKEALEQAKQEELRKQEELAVQNAMDGDEEEDKSISFTTEREMIKFFNFTLFKDPTIRGELERLNMDDKDFSNLKKVMAYLLSSTAEFMNENLKTMHLVSQGISTKPKKALKVLFTKEKELYKWFKEWIVDNTVQKKKLFKKIGEFLKKKNYNFNLEGLTIQRLQGLNFSAAPTDIPPKEEDAIKKTVEKVKNKLKDQYPDQDELMANVEQDVISVIQNPKNSEIFNWSTGQSSSELSSMVGDFVLNPKETTPKKKTKKRNWGKTQAQMRQDTAERGQVPVEEKLTRLLESFIKQQLRGK